MDWLYVLFAFSFVGTITLVFKADDWRIPKIVPWLSLGVTLVIGLLAEWGH